MGYHIKIGDKIFCQCNLNIDSLEMFYALGHSGMCSHKSKETADKQVAYLKKHGIPDAKVCDGFCVYVDEEE